MVTAIVTDSTSDIPPELSSRYGIHIVRNLLTIEGQNLEDGVDISREELYTRLPVLRSTPQTGTASPGVYTKLYTSLFRDGVDAIISIHPSARMSGVFNAANVAAQTFRGRVEVFDSAQISLALGFQAILAAQAASEGASLEKLRALLTELRARAALVAMLDTLEYAHRSGRISWAQARLGDMLRIKPMIEIKDGVIQSIGEARTRRKGILRLKELIARKGRLFRLAVLHTNAVEDAREFAASVQTDLPEPPLVVNVTPAIGVHAGPQALGFAVITV